MEIVELQNTESTRRCWYICDRLISAGDTGSSYVGWARMLVHYSLCLQRQPTCSYRPHSADSVPALLPPAWAKSVSHIWIYDSELTATCNSPFYFNRNSDQTVFRLHFHFHPHPHVSTTISLHRQWLKRCRLNITFSYQAIWIILFCRVICI